MEKITFKVPMWYKPGEVNKNGWSIPEDVWHKAMYEAMNRPGGLRVCLPEDRDDLLSFSIDEIRTVGVITDLDEDSYTLTIETQQPTLKTFIESANLKMTINGYGCIEEYKEGEPMRVKELTIHSVSPTTG